MSQAFKSHGDRHRWWPCSVSLAEANPEQPIDHQGKWQEGEDGQEDRAAQESGKDLLLAEEERARGDEESKTHTPEVTRDSLSACDTSASDHTDGSRGGEQEDGAEEETHAGRSVLVRMVEGQDAERDDGGCSAKANQERSPVIPAYVPAAAGEPRGDDHVEGDNTADNIAPLGFHDGETKSAGGQRHHRDSKDVSGGAMQTAAFANGHCERAGEQANGATEDVQNQERESHAPHPFSTCDS